MLEKIVSGGQTGADRAALDVALALGLKHGGWVPRGRRAEDGIIPACYHSLVEAESAEYAERTRLNVRDSDATLIVCYGEPSGGTALTATAAGDLGRPFLVLDIERISSGEAIKQCRSWVADVHPIVLNVAGPRLSTEPRIYNATAEILQRVLGSTDT